MISNSVYLVSETLAAIVVLVLIYANTCEVKQLSKSRRLFTRMLIISVTAIIADALTFVHFDWNKYKLVADGLITAAFVLPELSKVFFSLYLYEHISSRTTVNRNPFLIMMHFSMVETFMVFLLCVSGKLFVTESGQFYSGSLEPLYLVLGYLSMFGFIAIIIMNAQKIGKHDALAVMPFSIIPLLALVFTVTTGLNVTVMMISISMLVMYVMLQSEHETLLYGKANLDELTRLFNRAAYEEEIKRLEVSANNTLVYASIDLNGLKVTNDTLGHAAGDELLSGAADCIKSTFGKYGKVFRIGGDEFSAIFFADENMLQTLKADLEAATDKWEGQFSKSLSLSVGYVTKKECPDLSIIEMSKIADKRMYDAKAIYYANKGVDRRGQSNAYRVLCSLYTKILTINITDDSYSVVDMDDREQVKEKGYSDRISKWLEGFGKSGQVHPDDLESYLSKTDLQYMRDYFKSGKSSLINIYRRKYENGFRQVVMEMVPTKEYSDDNQTLFLYVKNID